MIKLEIIENEPVFYVSLIPYLNSFGEINEDAIAPDDIVKKFSDYSDLDDTRNVILGYVTDVSNNLESKYDFIDECNPRLPKAKMKRGISSYIDITIIHPSIVSEDDIKKHYMYTLRFSEHDDAHLEYGSKTIKIDGMKPKNFEKSATRELLRWFSEIQDKIKKYELEQFGKQLTFISISGENKVLPEKTDDENESYRRFRR